MIPVKDLAEKLADAYSTENYGGSWSACVKMLRRRGYDDRQVEAIIRSKWTRWAADASGHSYGRANSVDLGKWMDGLEKMPGFDRQLAKMVEDTFATEVRS